MEKFAELLRSATANIAPMYFQVNVDGGDPIYRERVYCYELYHQLRCIWPSETEFYLNGELDKAAHPILQQLGANHAKPDLLVHRPGYMSGNDTIIEVKSASAQPLGIEGDLRKLSLFLERVGYKCAIYLIYGYDTKRAVDIATKIAASIDGLMPIELWLHNAPQTPSDFVKKLGGGKLDAQT